MFKSGDRVKVANIKHGAAEHTLGAVGVVDYSNNEDGDYKVRFDDQDYWYYRDSELELADPAVSQGQQTGQLTSHDNPTLRDQFAMAALTGLCAAHPKQVHNYSEAAGTAYRHADALLAAREAG